MDNKKSEKIDATFGSKLKFSHTLLKIAFLE